VTPRCSVIIVTWNRRRELEPALDSVFRQTIADQLEVLVLDNGSTDDTVAWLTTQYAHPVRVFAFGRNAGACHARNAGLTLARSPRICFLDSDAEILSDDAIERCLQALDAGPHRAVAAPIWFDRACTQPFALGGYITPEGHFDGPRTRTEREDPHFLSTCFSVWERALLLELGGFDPWYFWGIEDMDLALRAYHRALRGETKGATRYRLVDGINILHEMSEKGRHYSPRDFTRKFRALERQRLYQVLAWGGVGAFLRVLVTQPLHLRRIQSRAWERRLTWRERFEALVAFPLLRLAMLPFDWSSPRRNHLLGVELPPEVSRTNTAPPSSQR